MDPKVFKIKTKMRKEPIDSCTIPPKSTNTKNESLDLFKVTFTEVIERTEMLTTTQINALLHQNKVKSIKIEK